jgi:hypothetical protein
MQDDIATQSGMGVVGLPIPENAGTQPVIEISLSSSLSSFSAQIDSLNPTLLQKERSQDALLMREFQSITGGSQRKTGKPPLLCDRALTGKRLAYKFISNDYSMTTYPKDVNEIGSTFQLQGFSEISYRATAKLTLDAGVNAQFLILNQTWNIDPRVGVSWKFKDKHELTFGYGLHSQYQGLEIYMTKLFSQAVDSKIIPINSWI